GNPGGPLPQRASGIHSSPGVLGYEYHEDRIVGSSPSQLLGRAYVQSAMAALQRDPNAFFPFDVLGQRGERSIILGCKYDLTNRGAYVLLPPGRFPVMVTQVLPTSFTFTTLEGHFDAPGSTITFTFRVDSYGTIHLEHRATAASGDPSLIYLLAPAMSEIIWDAQANAVRQWLSGIE